MDDKMVHILDNGCGDIMKVYEDRVIIQRRGMINFFQGGLKGDKTFYYADITSIQFRKPGFLGGGGYFQFTMPGTNESRGGLTAARSDENSFTYGGKFTAIAEKIYAFIDKKVREAKSNRGVVQAAISPAEELKKFKELLDMGVISQEEFDAKKKKLLGL